jgi:hypothetical protein
MSVARSRLFLIAMDVRLRSRSCPAQGTLAGDRPCLAVASVSAGARVSAFSEVGLRLAAGVKSGSLRQRVLSSAPPSVLGDFSTIYFIRQGTAVAKFSSGRMGARPPPPVGLPTTPVLLSEAAPAGPERHCRERRGPSAGDGLGNRGAIRAGLLCTDREHGGTQAVSRRSGSAREAWSEGSKVLAG